MTVNGAGWMIRAVTKESAPEALSVTWIVKFAVPAAEGVPLIWPAGLSDNPAGNAPGEIDHVNGGMPPLAPDSASRRCQPVRLAMMLL